MKDYIAKNLTAEIIRSFIGLALIASSAGYITSAYIGMAEESIASTANNDSVTSSLIRALAEKQRANQKLIAILDSAQTTGRELQDQVVNLGSAVDVLQKYAKTDKQLLEKYSKVYFLNENYIPESLATIDSAYTYDKTKTVQFHEKAYPFLLKMLAEAKLASYGILASSGYRSFGAQSSLKSSYKMTFGTTAANKFSADQGYSEHQLGTAIDFTTANIGGKLDGFDKTPDYLWLKSNAYKYGFILSYPTSNKYYIFEPWHWRFVGVALATELHNNNQYFYDKDQREINEYLVKVFDQN